MGASDLHIMLREILPNMTSTITVKAALDAGSVILVATGISFLGAGASPSYLRMGADGCLRPPLSAGCLVGVLLFPVSRSS